MRTDQAQAHADGIVPRLLSALATLGCRRPWWFVAGIGLSCLVCLWLAATKLTYETQRNDLHGPDKEYFKRWQKYVVEFGDDDDMVVVVKGGNKEQMIQALEELAGEIQQRSELFDRLFYKVDLSALRNRALLFLPAEQIRLIQDNLKNMSLLLEPPVLGGLDPLFGWKSLTTAQLLKEGERKALAAARGPGGHVPAASDHDFLTQLTAIARCAARTLEAPDAYRNPWQSILPGQPQQEQSSEKDLLAEPHYFVSGDGAVAFLTVRPFKEEGAGFTFAQKSIGVLRELAAKVSARHPGLEIGITGLPVLENDEMIASHNDTNLAGWLALGGVALLYLVVYRGWRYPFMTVIALLVGITWAVGWLTLTVGHLNILTSAFAVMLIGMGDYGVLWVTRFGAERRAGADLIEAVRQTAANVGPSNLTAALTTALAYFAAMIGDLKAVAELGWIAGSGVLLCAFSCFVCLPPLLAIFSKNLDVPSLKDPGRDPTILSLKDRRLDRRRWLPALTHRPCWVLAASLACTLVFGFFALQIGYDDNLLRLQAPSLESVKWQRTLMEHTAGTSWHALSYTNTPEEALSLKARFEQLPEVSRVVEAASLVPRDQERKLEQLRDIHTRLRRLPKRGTVIPHTLPAPDEVRRTAQVLLVYGTSLSQSELNESLRALIAAIDALEPAVAAKRLQAFEDMLTQDLAEDLHRLNDVSTPAPIRLENLPACLREHYIGQSGKWLLRVFAKENLWDFEPMQDFVTQIHTVDPDATGKPFTTLEGLKAMKYGFLWAGLYAVIAMVLVLQVRFGRVEQMLAALAPLAMGMIVTLGLMQLLGLSLNPANMIAFPLILGVGADNGVHVIHDYRARNKGRRYYLGHALGRGIMIKAFTSMLGFGALMIAQHRGLASLGFALTLGVAVCMATALIFLPCLLGLTSIRRPKIENATLPIAAKRAV
ncbi:MAG: MMPL family transporter [Planctomycetes bacterium]|nr:MMPL family transporter [Planctomycetota bacterium]